MTRKAIQQGIAVRRKYAVSTQELRGKGSPSTAKHPFPRIPRNREISRNPSIHGLSEFPRYRVYGYPNACAVRDEVALVRGSFLVPIHTALKDPVFPVFVKSL